MKRLIAALGLLSGCVHNAPSSNVSASHVALFATTLVVIVGVLFVRAIPRT